MSHTMRHIAIGGAAGAPRLLQEGCRWVGGQTVSIDSDLVRTATESTEAGKITELNFCFKFVQRISGLDTYAAHLRSLDLSSNNIRQIEGLEGMSKLRELKLCACQITRIQSLEPCMTLSALHLDDNRIGCIEGLDNLRALEYLNLDSNRISRIGNGLARLAKLKELHLSYNELTSLDGVVGLTNLEVLTASHNRLQEVTSDNFKGLGKLDDLQLAGNQLCDLTFLIGTSGSAVQPLPSLAGLDMSGNHLTAQALRGRYSLLQLTELNLASNQIAEIPNEVTGCFPSLEIFDLSKNWLERIVELERLKPLTSLRELMLQGNPFTSEPEELQRALAALGPLEYLDDRPMAQVKAEAEAAEVAEEESAEKTFRLTSSKAFVASEGTGTTETRPSTGSSRPSTAQSMKDAGVMQPLMHARLKLTEKRFVNEEQVNQWEKQTMNSLGAIEKQITKTVQQTDAELRDMTRFLERADRVLKREGELRAKERCPSVAEDPAEYSVSPRVPPAPAMKPLPVLESADERPPSSRAGRRLREAVEVSKTPTPEPELAIVSVPAEPEKPEEPLQLEDEGACTVAALPAACDEEINCEEDAPAAICDTEAEEVDEETVAEGATSEAEEKLPLPLPPPVELHTEARAEVRINQRIRSGGYRTSPAGPTGIAGAGRGGRLPPRAPAAARKN